MSGWKDWTVGEVVEESDFQSFVQNQVVQIYDNSTARGSALGTAAAEGMVSYLKDTNATEVYTGASWEAITGDITAVTAGTALTGGGTSGAVTLNVNLGAVTIPASQISDLTATASALNTIDDGTLGFTALSNGTAGVTYQPISPNYIINGAFDIWQRGTSFTFSTGSPYLADRFFCNPSGATVTVSQQSFTPADLSVVGYGEAQYYLRLDVTGADNNASIRQRVEDVRTVAGQTVTLSFWAKDTNAARISTAFLQNFGSGGSSIATTSGPTLDISTSWQRYSITLDIPSVSGKTIGTGSNLEVFMGLPNNETNTLDIWGVQLEAGSVATPFRRNANSIQGELAACQRYYLSLGRDGVQISSQGYSISTTVTRILTAFPVEMRTRPLSVEQNGTAGDYSIIQGDGTVRPCTVVPAYFAATTKDATTTFTNGAVMVVGQGAQFRMANSSFLAWSAEL